MCRGQISHAFPLQHRYLKDPTFVEYFNSFLLLPVSQNFVCSIIFELCEVKCVLLVVPLSACLQAFTRHVFYNSDTGYFEQVCGDGVRVGWGEGGVTPSTSLATLYLSDDTLGPVSQTLCACSTLNVKYEVCVLQHLRAYPSMSCVSAVTGPAAVLAVGAAAQAAPLPAQRPLLGVQALQDTHQQQARNR